MKLLKNKKQVLLVAIIATLIAAFLVQNYFPAYHSWELAVTTPPYQSATTCTGILLQLDDAVSLWAIENKKANMDPTTPQNLGVYFIGDHAPTCPNGGRITLGTRTLATTCSMHGMAQDNRPTQGPRKLSLGERFSLINLGNKLFPSSRSACIAYLKQMDGAAQQWALDNKKTDADLVDINASAAYVKGGQLPLCPAGGKYQFTCLSNPPVCTKAYYLGHSLP